MEKRFLLESVRKMNNKDRIFTITDIHSGKEQQFTCKKLFDTLFRSPEYYDCVEGLSVTSNGRILSSIPAADYKHQTDATPTSLSTDLINIIEDEIRTTGVVGLNFVYTPDIANSIYKIYSYTNESTLLQSNLTAYVDNLQDYLRQSLISGREWLSPHRRYMMLRDHFVRSIAHMLNDRYAVCIYKDDASATVLIAENHGAAVRPSCKWMDEIMEKYIRYLQKLHMINSIKFRDSRAEKAWTALESNYSKLSHGKHIRLSDRCNLTDTALTKLLIAHYHLSVMNDWNGINAEPIEQQTHYIPAWLYINEKMAALLSFNLIR